MGPKKYSQSETIDQDRKSPAAAAASDLRKPKLGGFVLVFI